MLSFKIEYSIRILVELKNKELAGIMSVPVVWLKSICGNDANGLSIVMRILRNLEWVNYDKSTYLCSINSNNVNIDTLSLYDLCVQVDEGSKSLAHSLSNDNTGKELARIFKDIKLSQFAGNSGSKPEENPKKRKNAKTILKNA